ncbi:MAG: hypothetical protein J6T06_05035, partial [Victivallales bacterium]|nr:hypothetical protein [Victivallales bacterium]
KTAILLHFDNDPTNYVSDSLRNQLLSTGILDLEEVPLIDRIRAKLHLRIPTYATLQDAMDATAQAGTDLVIWGQLTAFETTNDDSAVINGQYHLIDAQTMQPLFTGTISTTQDAAAAEPPQDTQVATVATEQTTTPSVSAYEATVPLYARILAFLFIAILLPMITFPFFRGTAARRSNQANAVVLVLYAAIGGILAFLMIGGSFATPALTALFFIAFIANVIYDLAMLSYATRLEE